MNFLAIPDSGPMFLKSIEEFGEIKDKYCIAKHMRVHNKWKKEE